MPGNLLAADTGLPDLAGKGSTEEKLKAVSGYLYMLLEQLRYTLSNLGQDNFNDTELEILGKTLTAPVEIRLKDAEGNMAELSLKADQLSSKVENVQKDVSTVTQTAQELSVKFESAQGKITTITQSVEGLGIHDDGGQSSLSGIALLFYDGKDYEVPGSLGFTQEKGNIIGRVRVDDDGAGNNTEAEYRLFVGTGRGYKFNGIGYDEVDYALKLQAQGSGSFTSETGDLYLLAAKDHNVQIDGGGRVNTSNKSLYGNLTLMPEPGAKVYVAIHDSGEGWYYFKKDGIYHGSKKIAGE